jgi:TRAP-type C4-dicarboxylate transport system substrate-binding protein
MVMTSCTRRHILAASLAAPALIGLRRSANAVTMLRISHQFPGGTIEEGDFRDRMCRRFSLEIAKRTNGALSGEVYPNSSLVKTNAQFNAMRKGALDLSLYPLAYAGGEIPELNITLMPCMVSNYAQGAAWKDAAVGRELVRLLAEKGVIIISWVWQAGGCASRGAKLVGPEDAKGQKVRGGSREMDLMFKQAGATVVSMPSNEAYAAMQTGAVDSVVTSSTSLVSFHLEELAKNLTAGNGKSYWFMFEPLLMSKAIFDALPKDQKDIVIAIGAELEKFGTMAAKADDKNVVEVYKAKGREVYELSDEAIAKWRDLARMSAWKDYGERSESTAKFLSLAQAVAENPA